MSCSALTAAMQRLQPMLHAVVRRLSKVGLRDQQQHFAASCAAGWAIMCCCFKIAVVHAVAQSWLAGAQHYCGAYEMFP